MSQCLLQLCLCLFCNQTRRFIYRSGEALYRESSYIEEKAVCVVNIHGKTNGITERIWQYYKIKYMVNYMENTVEYSYFLRLIYI